MAYKKLWLNINGANRMVVFDLEIGRASCRERV